MEVVPQADSLDLVFGPCISGKRKVSEQNVEPPRLHDLDGETCKWLEEIRKLATTNMIVQRLLTNMTILWVVVADGAVRFCIEHAYEQSSPHRRFPRPRETDDKSVLQPLGHPTLTDDDNARIAGELYLEQSGEAMVWVLSNKSARYGVGRTHEHLENVCARFSQLGLTTETYFIE